MSNKSKGTGSTIIQIIGVILVLVLVMGFIGVGFASDWFTDWSRFTSYEEELPAGDETPDEDAGTQDKTVRSVSFKAMSTSQEFSSGITKQITASVEPADATNKSVDWSIAWIGDVSEDISDYLTVSPTSDGSLTANITCLKSFRGKAALVTVTARDGGAQATCMISYKGEPSAFDFNNTGNSYYTGECNFKSTSSIPVSLTNVFGDVGEEYYDNIKIVKQEFTADVYTYDLDFTVDAPGTPSSTSVNKYKLSELKLLSDESVTADKTISVKYSDGAVTVTSSHYLNSDFAYGFTFNGYSGTYTGMIDHVSSAVLNITLECNGIQGSMAIYFISGVNGVTVPSSVTF